MNADELRGYREQAAWLAAQAPSIPAAEHTLASRLATLEDDPYNRGGDQATRDYITRATRDYQAHAAVAGRDWLEMTPGDFGVPAPPQEALFPRPDSCGSATFEETS